MPSEAPTRAKMRSTSGILASRAGTNESARHDAAGDPPEIRGLPPMSVPSNDELTVSAIQGDVVSMNPAADADEDAPFHDAPSSTAARRRRTWGLM